MPQTQTWFVLALLIAIFLVLGDTRAVATHHMLPTVLEQVPHSQWASWDAIHDDDRIRMLWIDTTYVPFVNAGNEVCTHQFNKFLLQQPYKWEIYVAAPNLPKRVYENVRCFDLHDDKTFHSVLERINVICSHNVQYRRGLQTLSYITGIPFVGWNHTIEYVQTHKHAWTNPKVAARHFTVHNSNSIQDGLPADKNSIVLFPPVNFRDYLVERKDNYITLINVNENKGGYVLIALAKECPELEFQGVLGGYGNQVKAKLPNLTYLQHTDKIQEVYETTKILIMPSKIETWGRTAVEAMSSGIPVVASPTPGLRECCGEAAIYIDRDDISMWADTLRRLCNDRAFYNKRSTMALERSRALDPIPGLERTREWMEKTVVPTQVPGRAPTWFEKKMMFM